MLLEVETCTYQKFEMILNYSSVLFLLLTTTSSADCSRILAVFYLPSISHQYVLRKIGVELSERGHEVTMVTTNPSTNSSNTTNLREIDVSVAYESIEKFDFTKYNREYSYHSLVYTRERLFEDIIAKQLNTTGMKELLKLPEDYFDLLLVEMHSSAYFGLMHKFKAPLISVSSLGAHSYFYGMYGNPTHPVLYPCYSSEETGPLKTIWAKIDSIYVYLVRYFFVKFSVIPRIDTLVRPYFGEDMPYIGEFMNKASLVMMNVNPIFFDGKPLAPNFVQFFNIHSARNEEFTKDLQDILDNAKEGVVYFSLGTNIRFHHLNENVKESILEALGELPYTVLCKWSSEDDPAKPKNVVLRTWFPQQSILAHPNVKVFVTQAGLQSSEEAISNALPIVAIPFLGDQPLNAKILTSKGMGETIQPKEFSKELLRDKILKVAKEESYRKNAEELRSIFLDQPQNGLDKVIWWCEYVIRHKGAKHLRSPAADIPLYEYLMLDVLAFILAVLFIVYKLISSQLRWFIRGNSTKSHKIETKKRN